MLDNKFNGPFGVTFGYDAIIGIIPGVGDLFTSVLSSYILFRALLLNLPLPILAQMAGNILIDQLIGIFPVVGDFFDIYWQSNQRNVDLIISYNQNQKRKISSLLFSFIFLGVFTCILFIIPTALIYKIYSLLL